MLLCFVGRWSRSVGGNALCCVFVCVCVCLPADLPACLPVCLPAFQHACLPAACLSALLLTCFPPVLFIACPPACLLACLLACLHAFLLACLPICLLVCLPACLPASLLSCRAVVPRFPALFGSCAPPSRLGYSLSPTIGPQFGCPSFCRCAPFFPKGVLLDSKFLALRYSS